MTTDTITDRDHLVELDEIEETEHCSQPVTEFLLDNYSSILAVENSWQDLEERIAYWLGEEHLANLLNLVNGNLAKPSSRGEQKASQKAVAQCRKNVNSVLAYAKYEAQLLSLGTPELQESAQERLSKSFEEHSQATDPYKVRMLEIHIEAVKLFKAAYGAEKELTDPLYAIISEDAALIEELIDFFESGEIDPGDYTGLLYALARNHFDPKDVPLLPLVVEALSDSPWLYQKHFIQENSGESEQETELSRLMRLLGEFALFSATDKSSVSFFLQGVEFAKLPQDVQREIAEANGLHLERIKDRYLRLITPYNKRRRFLLSEPPVFTTEQQVNASKKRAKNGSASRTTQRLSSNLDFSTQETQKRRKIKKVGFAKKTPDGYIIDDMPEPQCDKEENKALWRHMMVEEILNTRSFASYTDKYLNKRDVYAMVSSILTDPVGNGVSAMGSQRIKIKNANGGITRKNVLHFSSQDSKGLEFTQSTESNRTRIFYVIFEDQLVIIDIQHKTTAEQRGGTARR